MKINGKPQAHRVPTKQIDTSGGGKGSSSSGCALAIALPAAYWWITQLLLSGATPI